MAGVHLQLSAVVFLLSTLLTFGEYWLLDVCIGYRRQSGQSNEFHVRLIYAMTATLSSLLGRYDTGDWSG